jgi:hypothetical protein
VGSSLRKSSPALLGLALVVALAVSVPSALAIANPPTEAEYVETVEPICKTNADANSRILTGVKQQVQKGQLGPAGKRFIRASSALGKAVTQIAQVPKPPEDAAKLTKWIGLLKQQKTGLLKVGQNLKSEDRRGAQKAANELKRANNQANATVISIPFHECRIEASRFL